MTLAHFIFVLPLRIFAAMAKALFHSWFKLRWTPSSKSWLMHLDHKIRTHITHKNRGEWISITVDSETHEVWTVTVEGDRADTVPIVLIHGMGGGSNMFLNNIDSLAEQRNVYLLDLPGFGLSSRPELRVKYQDGWWQDTNEDDIENFYIDILEKWFNKMRLDKVILVGHSYGGFLSSVYCFNYPDRVKHLVLADPWGFPPRPKNVENQPFMRNKALYIVSKLYGKMNVFTPIRVLGPLGPSVFRRIRGDFQRRYSNHFMDTTFSDYLYACNTSDKPSGEIGFFRVSVPFALARKPLLERIQNWEPDLDVTFIYGARSWVDCHSGFETKYHRPDSYVDVHVISGAGHHMYADRPLAFNHIVNMIGKAVDNDIKPNISKQSELRNEAMSSLRRRLSHSFSQGNFINDEAGIRQPRAQNDTEMAQLSEENFSKDESTGSDIKITVSFTLDEVPGEESDSEENGQVQLENSLS